MSKEKIISSLDNLIFACLVIYSLTFITNINTKFLFFAFYICILKLFFIYKITYKKFLILLSTFSISLSINALIILYHSYLGEFGRPVGLCDFHYMFLAGVNLLIIPFILTYSLNKTTYYNKLHWLFRFTIFINIPALIFENTRIVWLAFCIIFPLVIFLGIKNKFKAFLIICCIAIYSFGIFQMSPQSTNRLESITNNNYENQPNYERLLMWQSASNMFIDHPIFGVGYHHYRDYYLSTYRSPLSREYTTHPHNTFLEKLTEAGLLGGISYLLLIFYFIYNSFHNFIKNKNTISLAYLACLLAYSIGCLTDCLFSSYNLKELTYIFYLLTGLYLSISYHTSNSLSFK